MPRVYVYCCKTRARGVHFFLDNKFYPCPRVQGAVRVHWNILFDVLRQSFPILSENKPRWYWGSLLYIKMIRLKHKFWRYSTDLIRDELDFEFKTRVLVRRRKFDFIYVRKVLRCGSTSLPFPGPLTRMVCSSKEYWVFSLLSTTPCMRVDGIVVPFDVWWNGKLLHNFRTRAPRGKTYFQNESS